MISFLTGFLSKKTIGYFLIILIFIGGGYYIFHTFSENGQLSEQVSNLKNQNIELTETIKNNQEDFTQTIDEYNSIMSRYAKKLETNREKTSELSDKIDESLENNKQLKQCLETDIDDSIIDDINNGYLYE